MTFHTQRLALWQFIILAFGCCGNVVSGLTVPTVQHDTAHPYNNHNHMQWEIHNTIQALVMGDGDTNERAKTKAKTTTLPKVYQETTDHVVQVLQSWALNYSGQPEWKSLLNKANLRHEVEESIVALHHLRHWANHKHQTTSNSDTTSDNNNNDKPFIAVDVCSGKGVFSTLLSYMAPRHFPNLSRIILFDKDNNIDWSHIHAANRHHQQQQGRPFLELWSHGNEKNTNLHNHDAMMEQFLALDHPLAMTGIHLCKTLSPRLVGLVNALGPETVPYLCLAPCCLPRSQQQISIPLYQSPLQRQAQLVAMQHRKQARQRNNNNNKDQCCYVCQGSHHVRDCPQRASYATDREWNQTVQQSLLLQRPCWNCGRFGHLKQDCTDKKGVSSAHSNTYQSPHTLLNMTSIIDTTKQQEHDQTLLFERYCAALADTIQHTTTVHVVDSGLTTASHEQHNKNNWNRRRKSLYIFATRTT